MSNNLSLANIVTLGVSDVRRERDFYSDLGWPVVLDNEDFVVFELRGGAYPIEPMVTTAVVTISLRPIPNS